MPTRISVSARTVPVDTSKDTEDYIYSYISPKIDDLDITGRYQKFDVGYMIIELNGTGFDVSYTLKNNICNVQRFDDCSEQPTFGLDNYKSEPRELKSNEKPNLHIKPDSIHRKLYAKLDEILKKTIKSTMTQSEKIKAIHDYVVRNITYSGYPDYLTPESALKAIDTKKGVCANYSSLFYYLCKRAQIPVRSLSGPSAAGQHMWNIVYMNRQWLHIDTTWDDTKNKTVYDYYLKPAEYMMKTRIWNGFGYPDHTRYPKIDGMKIKTTMEFRIFLLQQLSDDIPATIKFKLLNKNIDKDYRFIRLHRSFANYSMKYDSKSGLYIMKLQET